MRTGVFAAMTAACTMVSGSVEARDVVYQPVSPLFGGSPLNGGTLPSLAGVNNYRYQESPQVKRDRAMRSDPTSAAAQFERQITSALLGRIASQIGDQILGENARDSGTFSVGGTRVQFQRVGDQINVDIFESASGGRTNIQIPAPVF